MNEATPTLARLSLGQDVAEHEESLGSYFLRTGAYRATVQDESDLVLGAKGSGKSAIARFLSLPDVEIPELDDVVVLPAFNVRGSVLFRRLTEQFDDGGEEDLYRDLFLGYMVGLAGNHLLRTFSDAHDLSELERDLGRCGLLVREPSTRGVWRRVLTRIRPTLEVGLSGDGMPTLTGSAEFDAGPDESAPNPEPVALEILEVLLERVYDALELLGLRCWIVFDRLDEAFADAPDVEAAALRGLLRAHLDVCSFGRRLRSKLFLRSDVFERITRSSGFVNATHLRTSQIGWDSHAILHLVALRLVHGREGDPSDVLRGTAAVRKRCRTILPHRMDGQDPLVWLLLVTPDATGEYTPRNVLTLLRGAQLEQIQIAARDPVDAEAALTSLSPRALAVGYRRLSITRLGDTVYAESAVARVHVEKLRGKRTRFTRAELSTRLGVQDSELDDVLGALRRVGFLRFADDEFLIPPLYRPALFVAVHGAESRIGAAEPTPAGEDASPGTDAARPGRRRGRRAGRRRGGSRTGRDELVPSNQPSEIADEHDRVGELRELLDDHSVPGTSPGRSGPDPDAVIRAAREAGEEGDALAGFRLLHPAHTAHPAAASAAADLAYLAGDAEALGEATRVLVGTPDRSGPVVARLLVLSLAAADPAGAGPAAAAAHRADDDLQRAATAVVHLVSRRPDRELEFWASTTRMLTDGVLAPSAVTRWWPVLAASRVLAIERYRWERSAAGVYETTSGIRRRIWPALAWPSAARLLERHLREYTDPGPPTLTLAPYQTLSVAAVLDDAHPLERDLRRAVAVALADEVARAPAEQRDRFREWGRHDDLALDVDALRAYGDPDRDSTVEVPSGPDREGTGLDGVIVAILARHGDGSPRRLSLAALGSHLRGDVDGFDHRDHGYPNLLRLVTDLAARSDAFTVTPSGSGHPFVVERRPAG